MIFNSVLVKSVIKKP